MNNIISFLSQPQFYFPLLLWTIFWKGLALWKSATKKQLFWFILILVINTMGILEIVYVFILNKQDIDNGRLLRFIEKKFKNNK